MKPFQAALRFVLEILSLTVYALWGYDSVAEPGTKAVLLALALPVAFATLWGVFAVPDDPSRSGKTVVRTPGWLRFLLEIALLGAAAWMLLDLGHRQLALLFAAALLFHYSASGKRLRWLLSQK
ncbi:MAG: YrdB family protein [Bacteroidales bacterium]